MTIPAFPLKWPEGWKRTPASQRKSAKFTKQRVEHRTWKDYAGNTHTNTYRHSDALTIAQACQRVRDEIRAMTADDDFVLNSNLEVRLDGMPRSGQREPDDPGVVIYWRDSKVDGWPQRCMAIDRYDRVADNIAAIAATLQAMRAIERHGGAEILNRAFTGFAALEGPGAEHWSTVLGVNASASRVDIEAAYKRLRSQHHPDRGGNPEEFQRVQRAYEQANQ
jgi:hypothetical protein